MTPADFMQSKLFGVLFSSMCFFSCVWLAYQAGSAIAYRRGWEDGRKDNPKPEVITITEYVYDDKRIARFDPRTPNVFLLIDMKERTISRVPYDLALKKDVLVESGDTREER